MSIRLLVLGGLCAAQLAQAQRVGAPTDDLTNLSVEELFQIQVTSVGKKAQQMSKAPAAIFVLTADDIRRSGATSIPEALQWVPGLTVLRIDGRNWAISARGSASLYADKILVMIDGRSLYTPLFSGVIWDAIDVPLEDIEQIEVVRGPGAVMWGPNAVNGVINIITKSAHQTKGGEVSAATGNELKGSVLGRWGGEPSERLAYRVWVKLDDRDPAFGSPGYYMLDGKYGYKQTQPVTDLRSQTGRLGFRIDAEPTSRDQLMFEGDIYGMGAHDVLAYPILLPNVWDSAVGHTDYAGGFLQARWTRSLTPGNEESLQFTFNRDCLEYPFAGGDIDNLTLDYQRREQTGERNEFFWGGGFQQYSDNTNPDSRVSFNPASVVFRFADAVARDEFQLLPDRLLASVGLRVDYAYSRFEFQPTFRLLYTPNQRQSAWVALSRAVRVPSRFELGMQLGVGAIDELGIPVALEEIGSPTMRPETERSAEAGYRLQSGQRWSLDTSVFLSFYDNLQAFAVPQQPELIFVGSTPELLLRMVEGNYATGRSYGSETWATLQLAPKWRLIPSYSYLDEERWTPQTPGTNYAFDFQDSGSRHQGNLRSQYDLSRHWQLDLMARARSRNTAFDLPGVLLFDARLGWRPTRDSEFSIAAEDLAGRSVVETLSEAPFVAIPIRRTFAIRWTQKF